MMTADQYKQQLKQLLPPGKACDAPVGSNFDALLEGLSQEFARLDARFDAIINEADPQTTVELIPDWERVLGLPDPCVGLGGTLAQRRGAIIAALKGASTPSIPNLEAAAAVLGYSVTVEGFKSFDVNSACTYNLNNEEWRFVWQVNAPLNTITDFTVLSDVNDPLAIWGNTLLACVLSEFNQAHTVPIFAYS